MQWIGEDFDGTLVTDAYPKTGAALAPAIKRVREYLAAGMTVKIFTNRADSEADCVPVRAFCEAYFGRALEITNKKDRECIRIEDNIAWHVNPDGELA